MIEMYICQSDETLLSILHALAIAEGVVVASFAARCSKQLQTAVRTRVGGWCRCSCKHAIPINPAEF